MASAEGPEAVIQRFAALLEAAGVPYMLTGSFDLASAEDPTASTALTSPSGSPSWASTSSGHGRWRWPRGTRPDEMGEMSWAPKTASARVGLGAETRRRDHEYDGRGTRTKAWVQSATVAPLRVPQSSTVVGCFESLA
jgi:hypothetical protein